MSPIRSHEISQRYQTVLARIEKAASVAGRNKNDITVVVVSKYQPMQVVQGAIDAGICIFGENYAEEAARKITRLPNQPNLEWHMIGHIQSRKTKIVSEYFQRIHSLDSISLAQKLESQLAERQKVMPALIEFNIAGEDTKFGWDASNISQWDDLIGAIKPLFDFDHILIDGIMVMPPLSNDEVIVRGNFKKAKKLLQMLQERFPEKDLHHLSMGTSADYEIAVQEGATFVRIGEAILGERITRQVEK